MVAWKTIATDLFVFQDKTYILIIDLFSRFPVVRQLHGESMSGIECPKRRIQRFWNTRVHNQQQWSMLQKPGI